MAFMKINDLRGILTLVVLTLPSITANIDCNGKPFHCVNSTHFMICVDLGSGVSSTIDDFVIPCPPTTVCLGTNRFECEFPPITTTVPPTVQPLQIASEFSETIGPDITTLVYDVTTSIPFEEYFNTLSTTTLSEDKRAQAITESTVVTDMVENVNVKQPEFELNSNLNGTVSNVDVENNITTLNNPSVATESKVPDATEIKNVSKLGFASNSTVTETTPSLSVSANLNDLPTPSTPSIASDYNRTESVVTAGIETIYVIKPSVTNSTMIETTQRPTISATYGELSTVRSPNVDVSHNDGNVLLHTTEVIKPEPVTDFTLINTNPLVLSLSLIDTNLLVSGNTVQNDPTAEVIQTESASVSTLINTYPFVSGDAFQNDPTTAVIKQESVTDSTLIDTNLLVSGDAVPNEPATEVIQTEFTSDSTLIETAPNVSGDAVQNNNTTEVIQTESASGPTLIDITPFVSGNAVKNNTLTEVIKMESASDSTLIDTNPFVSGNAVQIHPTTEVIKIESASDSTLIDTTIFVSGDAVQTHHATEEIKPKSVTDSTLIDTNPFVSVDAVQNNTTTEVIKPESVADFTLIDTNPLVSGDAVPNDPTTEMIQTEYASDSTLIDTAPLVSGDAVQNNNTTEVMKSEFGSDFTLIDVTSLVSGGAVQNHPTTDMIKMESASDSTLIETTTFVSGDAVQTYRATEEIKPISVTDSTLIDTNPFVSGIAGQNYTTTKVIKSESVVDFSLIDTNPLVSGDPVPNDPTTEMIQTESASDSTLIDTAPLVSGDAVRNNNKTEVIQTESASDPILIDTTPFVSGDAVHNYTLSAGIKLESASDSTLVDTDPFVSGNAVQNNPTIELIKMESSTDSTLIDTNPFVSVDTVQNYTTTEVIKPESVADFTLIETNPLVSGDAVTYDPTTEVIQTESASDSTVIDTIPFVSDDAVQIYTATEVIKIKSTSDSSLIDTSTFVSGDAVSNVPTTVVIKLESASDSTLMDTDTFISGNAERNYHTTEVTKSEFGSVSTLIDVTSLESGNAVQNYPTTVEIKLEAASVSTLIDTTPFVSGDAVQTHHTTEGIKPKSASTLFDTNRLVSGDAVQNYPATEKKHLESASNYTLIVTTPFLSGDAVQEYPTTELIQKESISDSTLIETTPLEFGDAVQNYNTTKVIKPVFASDPTVIDNIPFVTGDAFQNYTTTEVIQTESVSNSILIDTDPFVSGNAVQNYLTTEVIKPVFASDPTVIDTIQFVSGDAFQNDPTTEVIQTESVSDSILIDTDPFVSGNAVQNYPTTEVIKSVIASDPTVIDTIPFVSGDAFQNDPTTEVIQTESVSDSILIDTDPFVSGNAVQNYPTTEVIKPESGSDSPLTETTSHVSGDAVQNFPKTLNTLSNALPSSINMVKDAIVTILEQNNTTQGETESNSSRSEIIQSFANTQIDRLGSSTISSKLHDIATESVVTVTKKTILTENAVSTKELNTSLSSSFPEVVPPAIDIITEVIVTPEISTEHSLSLINQNIPPTTNKINLTILQEITLTANESKLIAAELSVKPTGLDIGNQQTMDNNDYKAIDFNNTTEKIASSKSSGWYQSTSVNEKTTENVITTETLTDNYKTTSYPNLETTLQTKDIESTSYKNVYDLNSDIENIGHNQDVLTKDTEDSTAATPSYFAVKEKENLAVPTTSADHNAPVVYTPTKLTPSLNVGSSESTSINHFIIENPTTPGFVAKDNVFNGITLDNPMLSLLFKPQAVVTPKDHKKFEYFHTTEQTSSTSDNTIIIEIGDTDQFTTTNFPADSSTSSANIQTSSSDQLPFISTESPHVIFDNVRELITSKPTSVSALDITDTSKRFSTESLTPASPSDGLITELAIKFSPSVTTTQEIKSEQTIIYNNDANIQTIDKTLQSGTVRTQISENQTQTNISTSLDNSSDAILITSQGTPGREMTSIAISQTEASSFKQTRQYPITTLENIQATQYVTTETQKKYFPVNVTSIPISSSPEPQQLLTMANTTSKTIVENIQATQEVATKTQKKIMPVIVSSVPFSSSPRLLQLTTTENIALKETTEEIYISGQASPVIDSESNNYDQVVTERFKNIIIDTTQMEKPTKPKTVNENISAIEEKPVLGTILAGNVETNIYSSSNRTSNLEILKFGQDVKIDESKIYQGISITASNVPIIPLISAITAQLAESVIPTKVTKPIVEVPRPSTIANQLLTDVTSTRLVPQGSKIDVHAVNTPNFSDYVLNTTENNTSLISKTKLSNVPNKQNITKDVAALTDSLSNQEDIDVIVVDVETVQEHLQSDSTHSGISVIPKPSRESKAKQSELSVGVNEKKTESKEKAESNEKPEGKDNSKAVNKEPDINDKPESNNALETAKSRLPFTNQINRLDSANEKITQKPEDMVYQSNSNNEQLPSTGRLSTENTTPPHVAQVIVPSNMDLKENTAYTNSVAPSHSSFISNNSITNVNIKTAMNITFTSSVTNARNFVCNNNSRGRHSDKKDCRKFFICIGKSQPIEGICPNNTVFSEIRKQCTKNLSHCIRNNQFQCISEGRFSDYFNDNVYYVCMKNNVGTFIRFQLQCQSGFHLNRTSVRCALNTESISTSDISKNSDQSVSSSKNEKLVKESSKKFECKKSGKFPDAIDCRKYYVCIKTGKSYETKVKKCDSDEIFHKDKKKCVDADSYECS